MSHSTPRSAGITSKIIPTYFPQGDKKEFKGQARKDGVKMAEAGKHSGADSQTSTKADVQEISGRLDNLEAGLLNKIADLLQPISSKLEQLNLNLQKVAGIAETAMEMCMIHKEDLRALQESDLKHSEQIAVIGNRQRYYNLKFRGLVESQESEADLNIYMMSWLASELKLEGNCAPLLTQSFRLGKANNPARKDPRDIISTFADVRTKNAVLEVAKARGHLLHRQDRVLVFQDLTPETLQKRKELKEITASLREANIRHRWATPLSLQLWCKGKSYTVRSEEEGLEILALLNLATPMKTDKASFKRKLFATGSPPQHTKKSNTESAG